MCERKARCIGPKQNFLFISLERDLCAGAGKRCQQSDRLGSWQCRFKFVGADTDCGACLDLDFKVSSSKVDLIAIFTNQDVCQNRECLTPSTIPPTVWRGLRRASRVHLINCIYDPFESLSLHEAKVTAYFSQKSPIRGARCWHLSLFFISF